LSFSFAQPRSDTAVVRGKGFAVAAKLLFGDRVVGASRIIVIVIDLALSIVKEAD